MQFTPWYHLIKYSMIYQPDFHGNVRLTRIKFISAYRGARRRPECSRITRESIWREFVLCQIGIVKRANVTLFPPHNSRAHKVSKRNRLLLCRPNYWSSHDRIVRASHRNPSFCLTPVGFYTEILSAKPIKFILCDSNLYGNVHADRQCRATWLMLFTYDKFALNWRT